MGGTGRRGREGEHELLRLGWSKTVPEPPILTTHVTGNLLLSDQLVVGRRAARFWCTGEREFGSICPRDAAGDWIDMPAPQQVQPVLHIIWDMRKDDNECCPLTSRITP